MYVLKTKLNDSSVAAFLDSVPDEKKRTDSIPDTGFNARNHWRRAEDVGIQYYRIWQLPLQIR